MAQKKTHYRSAKAAVLTKRVLIYVILALICVIWLIPFVYLISQSLSSTYSPSAFFPAAGTFTFKNYVDLFTGEKVDFWRWFLNTLLIALANMVIQTILTLMTSYALSRLRFKGRQGLMKGMLILGMFPGFLGMIATLALLKLLGLNTSIFALVIVYAAGSAMGYYISKGFFDTIPRSLDEAVFIDGGTKNTVFWRVIMPLSKPIVVYTLLMSFTAPWGDFMMASYIAAGHNNMKTVAVGLRTMINVMNWTEQFNLFCAGAVFTSIPIMVLFFFLQKYYVEGVTGGAVKG